MKMHSILTIPTTTGLRHIKPHLPTHFLGTHSAKVCSMQEWINFMQINRVRPKSVHRSINPHLNSSSSIKHAEQNFCLSSLAN